VSSRLNILYVGLLPPMPGGSAISCSQLVIGWAGLGHAVRAVAPITPQALRFGDKFAASHLELDLHRFLMPYFDRTAYVPPPDDFLKLEGEQIRQVVTPLIERERPDVILIGDAHGWHVPEIAKSFNLPSVLLVRGNPTLAILRGAYPERLVERFVDQCRKVSLIVTPAAHLSQGLRQLGFGDVKTIPNAIDLNQFSPSPKDGALRRELSIEDGDTVVMLVASLVSRKRPLEVVASAEITLKHNSALTYVIVGDGPEQRTMEEACRERGIAEKFRFVGWIEYALVPRYLNLADVVVLPSESEGLARVYLEAQACARLLLASDIAPAREVVVHGETGLLFRSGDVEDLAAKTLLATGDPDLRAEIGRKARLRVRDHSLDDALGAYLAAMTQLV
jgi:glycosyltransferase involved in cell wall biosynthesis